MSGRIVRFQLQAVVLFQTPGLAHSAKKKTNRVAAGCGSARQFCADSQDLRYYPHPDWRHHGLWGGSFRKPGIDRQMCLGQETLHALAMDDKLTVIPRNQVFLLEPDQML